MGRKKHHITADKHFDSLSQAKLLLTKASTSLSIIRQIQHLKHFEIGLGAGLYKKASRFATNEPFVVASFQSRDKLNLISNYFKVTQLAKSTPKEKRVFIQHYEQINLDIW